MREIIFRGKRIDNDEWVYGAFCPYCWINSKRIDNPIIIEYNTGEVHEVVPETVGQYTGLKDKSGTKIFEGDIIVLSNDNIKGEIIFNEKLSAFQLRYLGELRELFEPKFLGEWITCYGIIGNIHDNPELLEKR